MKKDLQNNGDQSGLFITINGEATPVEIKNGKLSAKGYDLENERIALAITGGFGSGVAVAIMAIMEMSEDVKDYPRLIESLNHGLKDWEIWKKLPEPLRLFPFKINSALFQYLSYSMEVEERSIAAEHVILSEKLLSRLYKDPEIEVGIALAHREDLPRRYQSLLTRHPSIFVRGALLENKELPVSFLLVLAKDENVSVRQAVLEINVLPAEVLLILARDEDANIRSNVAYRENCPSEILEVLAYDPAVEVNQIVFSRKDLPLQVQMNIAKRGGIYQKESIAYYTKDKDVLAILARDHNPGVAEYAIDNPFYLREADKKELGH